VNDRIGVNGIIIASTPVDEYDRRVVIITDKLGKISAFVRGARRPTSPMLASSMPFAYGAMTIFEGRNSYSLDVFDVVNYFESIPRDITTSCYASYFAEFCAYYCHEGLPAADELKLLYTALYALSQGVIPARLIKDIFELRLMAINGDYSEEPLSSCKPATAKAWNHVLTSPLKSLFGFTLDDEALRDFESAINKIKAIYIDTAFSSLEVLKALV